MGDREILVVSRLLTTPPLNKKLFVVENFPARPPRKSDAEWARDSLIEKVAWEDIATYADRISAEVVTGFLESNGGIASAVILFSPENDAFKALRVSYASGEERVEFSSTSEFNYWERLNLKESEAKRTGLKSKLSMARANITSRIPRNKIFRA